MTIGAVVTLIAGVVPVASIPLEVTGRRPVGSR
jgi:hypothetical protein